jgi:uncharacterized protein YktA (UPF0223 family)
VKKSTNFNFLFRQTVFCFLTDTNYRNTREMGGTVSTIDPQVFEEVKQEYEKNKEKMSDEEMFNHISNLIKAKAEEKQKTETSSSDGGHLAHATTEGGNTLANPEETADLPISS